MTLHSLILSLIIFWVDRVKPAISLTTASSQVTIYCTCQSSSMSPAVPMLLFADYLFLWGYSQTDPCKDDPDVYGNLRCITTLDFHVNDLSSWSILSLLQDLDVITPRRDNLVEFGVFGSFSEKPLREKTASV